MFPLSLQSMGNFFCKKALHEETDVFGEIYWGGGEGQGIFYMEANDQIMQRGKIFSSH